MNRISFLVLFALFGLSTITQAQTRDTLTLNEAVSLAIKQSPAIMQGQAALDAARARTAEVEAVTKPQLSANGTYTRIDPVPSVTLGASSFQMAPNDNYNANVSLQQS